VQPRHWWSDSAAANQYSTSIHHVVDEVTVGQLIDEP
jgi:hypothetical protein